MKSEKHWIDNWTLYLKRLEKEEEIKISRRKEIINIRAEINDKGQEKVNDYIKDLVNTKEYNKKTK